MFGKKTNKIKCLSNKKVRKLISSGKRSLNCPFLKLVRLKTKGERISLRKVGSKEESLDMAGGKLKRQAPREAVLSLKIIRQKPSRKDIKPSLSKKHPKVKNPVALTKLVVRVRRKEDDIF